MKKLFALLLTLAMLAGMMPTAIAAEAGQTESGTTVQAVEIPGASRLDYLKQSGGRQPAGSPRYQDDDMVTVMIQMDEPSLLDYYNQLGGQDTYGVDDGGEERTAGEAVASFLDQPEVQAAAEDMLAQQQSVLNQIGGLQPAKFRAASAEPEVLSQWTALINGMAVRVPYGSLSAIRAIDGVKRAYVEHIYAAPEPVMEGAGPAGFSYDMVGLSEAWGAGYTGKGMLVAVLDTGLDLEWASFFDEESGDNVTDIRRTHEAFREDSFKNEFEDSELRYTEESIKAFLGSHELIAHKMTSPSAVNDAAYKNRKVVYAFDYAGDADPYTGEIISGDVNVYPGQDGNNHGTHVAGTVAGYAKTAEGAVTFSGVAPDAQLVIMKVFPDAGGGAPESATTNALEDTLKLGADVVNLSLGSDNGFADDDSAQVEIYASLERAGLILMTSAGNSNHSSTDNSWGMDLNLSRDPEISMVGSPSVYPSNLSVASINNTVNSQMTLVWSDGDTEHSIPFTDPFDVAMKSTFAKANMPEGGIEIIPAGYGSYEDYSQAGFNNGWNGGRDGIALVRRGGPAGGEPLTFVDKVKNADSFSGTNSQGVRYGVQGVIICDNVDGDLVNMSISESDGVNLTSAFISKAAGDAMIAAIDAGKTVTLKWVNPEDELIAYEKGGQMSEFTSWGATPGLELKPEITAPGGNIWSSVFDTSYKQGSGYYDDYTGSYAMMSGTSMSAPHMSGLGALVRQYVKSENLAQGAAAGELTSRLLVSTAVPQVQKEEGADTDAYYSPRRQGAGLVNIGAAITTPAYITVDGQTVGKLELKDDPNWTGSYPVSFKVHNLTDTAVTYTVQAAVQRPGTTEDEDGSTFMLDSDVPVKTVSLGTVTVPANGEATVTGTITLTAAEIASVRELFPNGTYIEGFITLTSTDIPQIGLPYLAFLGDWTAAPIFDANLWCDEDPEDPEWNPWEYGGYTWMPSIMGSAIIGPDGTVLNWLNLGQNIFDSSSSDTQVIHHKGNITISPNRDGYFDTIDDIELYQMRDAKLMVVEVRDEETGELYFRDFATYNFKTYYDAQYGVAIPSTIYYFTENNWDGTDLEGSRLPSGTKCVYTITAYCEGEYGNKVEDENYDYPITNFEGVDPTDPSTEPTFNGHAMDKTGDVISFPVVVDYEAPKLDNNAVTIFEQDGRTYIKGTVRDAGGSLASVEIVPIVTRTTKEEYLHGSPAQSEVGPDLINPFYSKLIFDENLQEWAFEADVTEYAHTNKSMDDYGYSQDDYYDWEWTGSVYIYCGDYGANDRAYSIAVKDMAVPGEILLSQSSAKLHPGSEFELSVINNTGSDAGITRTSTNPEVATVDEFGMVTAIAPGQTVIEVSNGISTARCVVAVEEWPTEVIDFDLSLRHFEGLKAGAPITVDVTNLQPADVEIENISWLVYEDDEDWGGLVNVYQNSQNALSGQIELNVSASEDAIPAGSGYLEVTINGHSERMTFTWEDVPLAANQDDLVVAGNYNEQTVFVPFGETAALVAKYKQAELHSVVPVKLYTAVDAENSQLNSTEPAAGLILDAQPFAGTGTEWSGKIVNEEGYVLPDSIRLFTRYSDYEVEITNDYTTNYTYDSATGEIWVAYAPYGSDNTMVIRADGVASEGAPAGTLSGETYEMPDGLYGPFDWSMTTGLPEGVASVSGELEPFEDEVLANGYDRGNGARFTPSAPGVSYVTAASKDGEYSVNFAVVCEPVKAETLELSEHSIELMARNSKTLTGIFDPEPTLDADKELVWSSFNPDVATVSKDGTVTGVSEGYAYIKAAVKTDTTVESYCVVKVTPAPIVPVTPGTGTSKPDPKPSADVETGDKKDDSGVTVTTATPDSTVKDGSASAVISNSMGKMIVQQAADNESQIVVIAPKMDGNVTGAEVSIPASTAKELAGKTQADVQVSTPVADVVIPNGALDELAAAGGQIVVSAQRTAGNELDITVTANGTQINKVTGGVTVTVPQENCGPGSVAMLVLEDGSTQVVRQSLADKDGQAINIPLDGSAKVVIVDNSQTFSDVPDSNWAADAIAFVSSHELMTGTGGSAFEPKTPLTRGMLAKVLHNMENNPTASVSVSFSDVQDSAWYAGAIQWASEKGIVNGYPDGTFGPQKYISREQLAVMLFRYAGSPEVSAFALNFADAGEISSYATDALAWAVKNQILQGKGDGVLDPKGTATRAEAAQMLLNFMTNVVW